MKNLDVIITGAGVVSPIGDTVEDFWRACLAGRSGLKREWEMDLSGLPCGWVGGILDDGLRARVRARSMTEGRNWGDALLWDVVRQATADAGLEAPLEKPAGLIWIRSCPSSGCSPNEYDVFRQEQLQLFHRAGADFASAVAHLRETAPPGEQAQAPRLPDDVRRRLGTPLFATRIEATCSGGLRAIAEGARLLRSGQAEVVVVAGAVSRRSPYVLSQYAQLMALSRWNGAPEQASMPFDRRRSGMVMAEGAAAIVMETAEHARRRACLGAYATVGGWGLAVDTVHVTAPTARMVERVIQTALDTSQIGPADVDAINAHGTSTKLNDVTEARALHAVLGKHMRDIDVSAVKSLTGHASAASGILEVIAVGKTLCDQVVPPVVTCTEPDEECAVKINLTAARKPVRAVVKNSFGFGGQYASMVFRQPEQPRLGPPPVEPA